MGRVHEISTNIKELKTSVQVHTNSIFQCSFHHPEHLFLYENIHEVAGKSRGLKLFNHDCYSETYPEVCGCNLNAHQCLEFMENCVLYSIEISAESSFLSTKSCLNLQPYSM